MLQSGAVWGVYHLILFVYEKGNFSMIDYEYARYELRTKVASRPKTVYTGVMDGNMARSVFHLFF